MAANLKLNLNICESSCTCKWLEVTDTTGIYNASTNPYGWDSSSTNNPSTTDVTSSTFTIVDPSGLTYTIDSTYPIPSTSNTDIFIIYADDLGLSSTDKLLDGIYEITWTVGFTFNGSDETVSNTSSYLFTCQADCGVKNLYLDAIKSSCSSCKTGKKQKANEAYRALLEAKMAASCDMPDKAKELLAKAQWIIKTQNCLNC